MSDSPRTIAVITGDLVNSTALGPAGIERAMTALADCAETQADWHGAPLHFTRHRGDGWQVVLARPEMALRSALAFRAALKATDERFDSYMGISVGVAPLSTEDLNAATSQVFRQSGIALDVLKNTQSDVRLDVAPAGILAGAAILADTISQEWTGPQARAIQHTLDPTASFSHTELALNLGISRQAFTKSLKAARGQQIHLALAAIEQEGSAQ